MKRWQKFALTAGAVALLAAGGGMSAWGGDVVDPPNPDNTAPADPGFTAAAAIDTAVESKYTPITPCRIVDTRAGGGKMGANTTRAFVAAGTSGFTGQGGSSTGCGVPLSATAIQATVIAVEATGTGYVRTYPDNVSAPTATFLSFRSGVTSGSGSITVDTAGSYDFKASVYQKSTHLVIDVQGYYIKPMWAYVNSTGTIAKGSRTAGSTKLGAGWYEIKFDRDVSNCAYSATSYYSGNTIEAEPRIGVPNAVWVALKDSGGNYVDVPFYVTVTC